MTPTLTLPPAVAALDLIPDDGSHSPGERWSDNAWKRRDEALARLRASAEAAWAAEAAWREAEEAV